MICPYIINVSVLIGGLLSWGVMWPLIETRQGDWYPEGLSSNSMRGIQGYKVHNLNSSMCFISFCNE